VKDLRSGTIDIITLNKIGRTKTYLNLWKENDWVWAKQNEKIKAIKY
jgi:hypothetical protein